MLQVLGKKIFYGGKYHQILICAPLQNEYFNRVTIDDDKVIFKKIDGTWRAKGVDKGLLGIIARHIETYCYYYSTHSVDTLLSQG
jgi:hypothetical protein